MAHMSSNDLTDGKVLNKLVSFALPIFLLMRCKPCMRLWIRWWWVNMWAAPAFPP